MAKALRVKVELDNKEYNAELAKSSNEMRKMAREQAAEAKRMQKGFDEIKGAVKSFGVAFFAAMGTKEVFNKFINSSQETADAFGRCTAQMKGYVDSFFIQINQGSFEGFFKNLAAVQKAVREAFNNQDILDDMRLSDTVIDAKTKAEGERIRTDYKFAKANGDTAEMERLNNEYKALMENFYDETRKTQTQTLKTAVSDTNAYLANFALKATEEDILYYATETNKENPGAKALVENFSAKMEEYDKKIASTKIVSPGAYGTAGGGGQITINTEESKLWQKKKEEYIEANKFAAIQYRLYNQSDESRKKWFGELSQYYTLEQSYQQFRGQGARIEQGTINAIKSDISTSTRSQKSKEKEEITIGSIKDFQTQISELEKQRISSTSKEEIRSIDKQINYLRMKIGELAGEPTKFDGMLTKLDIFPKVQALNPADVKLPEFEMKVGLPEKKDFEGALQGFGAIADIMQNIGKNTDNATAAMLEWGATTLSSIGAAIPAIAALTISKKAEATANTQAAASGAASSVASIPIVGWLLAGAAVAAVIAAILSAPKFEYGGIVGGTSFTGDNVLVRANSGEMILNQSQQSNLFNTLNGGALSQNTTTANNGRVEFKIRGNALVGVLNNHAKQTRI